MSSAAARRRDYCGSDCSWQFPHLLKQRRKRAGGLVASPVGAGLGAWSGSATAVGGHEVVGEFHSAGQCPTGRSRDEQKMKISFEQLEVCVFWLMRPSHATRSCRVPALHNFAPPSAKTCPGPHLLPLPLPHAYASPHYSKHGLSAANMLSNMPLKTRPARPWRLRPPPEQARSSFSSETR